MACVAAAALAGVVAIVCCGNAMDGPAERLPRQIIVGGRTE